MLSISVKILARVIISRTNNRIADPVSLVSRDFRRVVGPLFNLGLLQGKPRKPRALLHTAFITKAVDTVSRPALLVSQTK